MAKQLEVAVITPEGPAFEGHASNVVLPAHDGEVAFYADHAPFVGAVGTGELRITTDEGTQRFFLEGGVVQVVDNVVSVLAEFVRKIEEVVVEDAKKELAEALSQVPTSEDEELLRDAKLERARVQIRISEKPGHH